MGLDQPLPVQYVVWLGHIVRGDLGKSIFSKLPVEPADRPARAGHARAGHRR